MIVAGSSIVGCASDECGSRQSCGHGGGGGHTLVGCGVQPTAQRAGMNVNWQFYADDSRGILTKVKKKKMQFMMPKAKDAFSIEQFFLGLSASPSFVCWPT